MIEPLIIINLTPNSFSDGGVFYNETKVQEFIRRSIQESFTYFDLGAESTAPFNDPISVAEEIDRLSSYLNVINDNFFKISLDTYHLETVKWFQEKVNRSFLWNDVSGILDKETLKFLKDNPEQEYVLSHTNIKSKDQTSHHMDFVFEGDIYPHILAKWNCDIQLLKENNISLERIYFDPCFGFSKSFDQNFELIKRLVDLEADLPISRWLLGISKKSFLRKKVESFGIRDKDSQYQQSELLHLKIAEYWEKHLKRPILLRLHEKSLFNVLKFQM